MRCSRNSASSRARSRLCTRRKRCDDESPAAAGWSAVDRPRRRPEMDDKTQTDKMLSRKEGRVGYVIFNNPERHNAVSLDMWAATAQILDRFAKDDEVRAVVITGAGGKSFVSGADISK